jgi:hypothetical protein
LQGRAKKAHYPERRYIDIKTLVYVIRRLTTHYRGRFAMGENNAKETGQKHIGEPLHVLEGRMQWESDSAVKLNIFLQLADRLPGNVREKKLTTFMNMLPFGNGSTDMSKRHILDATASLKERGLEVRTIPGARQTQVRFEIVAMKR